LPPRCGLDRHRLFHASYEWHRFSAPGHAICPQVAAVLITGHRIEPAEKDLRHVPVLRATLFKPISWRTLAKHIIKPWSGADQPVLKEDTASL
jgi:hypothetical protein